MSKWLRRGLGQQAGNTSGLLEDHHSSRRHTQSDFPSPPRNDMSHSSAAHASAFPPPPATVEHNSGMEAFASSPAPMDVDQTPPPPRERNSAKHYSNDASRRTIEPRNQQQHSSRSSHHSSSGRSSSRDRRQRSSASPYPQQQQQQQPLSYSQQSQQRTGTGATSAPGTSSTANINNAIQQAAEGQHLGGGGGGPQTTVTYHHHKQQQTLTGSTTPPEQPTFPPPAVTADSPQPSTEATQRRPAYLLHRDLVIGKGSYGQVCIASRGEPEGHVSSSGRSGKRKKFACKCVMLRNDPKYIAKLQEEVNVLRELRGHENVIRLYDVFCVDNELFIITELGRGGDLFHLLTTHPKHGVTESYAAKTVAEMLSAVAFLHSRSICHRDLKLENWVLESGKDVWSPLKLIDFGLSTHFSRGQRLSRVVGSSYYVAPEVLKKSYTEACDLWSLGVIVYMLLSGAPPFYGKNDEAIKASIVQGEYTFPHELFRDVSDEAMAFVSTLLSYNIEYRYTAEQALTHPWLASCCDPEILQKCKEGAQGSGITVDNRLEPMQL